MKRPALVVLLLSTLVVRAEDWQATVTPTAPGAFPMLRPLRATYKFGWSALDAATAEIDFSTSKDGLLKLELKARTVGLVRSLWRMDCQQTASCQVATLRPVSAQQTEIYKDQTLQTKLDFGPEGVARLRESKPPDKNPARTKYFKFSPIFDLHSALLFVRSQPLRSGDVLRLVVYPATDPYLAEIAVSGRETIEVGKEQRRSIKLGVKLHRITKKLELESHKKFKRATVWMSDDGDRLLLKIAAEISVGSVWAEMETVEFAAP